MVLVDISWPLTENSTTWRNAATRTLQRKYVTDQTQPFYCRESHVSMGCHTGTHIDAPAHFVQGGKTIDLVDPEQLIGPCVVLDLSDVTEQISAEALKKHENLIEESTIVLLKTRNSSLDPTAPFDPKFVFLGGAAAQYLASKRVKAVGIDYLGIERDNNSHPAHHALLSNPDHPIIVIEGLRLGHVSEGRYHLIVLPLKLVGADGAPARALLTTP